MCCLSPCGNYVTCGSESGILHVWNVYKGISVTTYSPYKFLSDCMPIHGVQFHPVGNFLAFSHYGTNLPICIYTYDDKTIKNSSYVTSEEQQNQNIKCSASDNQNVHLQNGHISFDDILCKIDQLIIPESVPITKQENNNCH